MKTLVDYATLSNSMRAEVTGMRIENAIMKLSQERKSLSRCNKQKRATSEHRHDAVEQIQGLNW
jgi:hypothetical protein